MTGRRSGRFPRLGKPTRVAADNVSIAAGGDVINSSIRSETHYHVEVSDGVVPPDLRRLLGQVATGTADTANRRAASVQSERAYADWLLPRARASVGDDDTWDFAGRHEALRRVAAWLANPADGAPGLVVTGTPGSGKTAVLGLIASLADPAHEPHVNRARVGVDAVTAPPKGSVTHLVYAAGMTIQQVTDAIAGSVGVAGGMQPAELRRLLQSEQSPARELVILIDAVDEAGEAEELVTQVLKPLLDGRCVRLLLGMRPQLVPLLGGLCEVADLDADCADPAAIRRYVSHCLLQAMVTSPYREASPAVVSTVAEGIARAAGQSFLVARLLARMLASRTSIPPLTPGWDADLPSLPGTVMEEDLRTRLGTELARRAIDLLRPLAFAEGRGLPEEDIWAPLARRLSDRAYDHQDVLWLREHAASYIVEADDNGHAVFHPYHLSLGEYLRDVPDVPSVHRHFVDYLLEHAPVRPDLSRDWSRASFYTLAYLPAHIIKAASYQTLDRLVVDPDYLLNADPYLLLRAIRKRDTRRAPESPEVRAATNAYRQAAVDFLRSPPTQHEAILDLAVRSHNSQILQARMTSVSTESPWRVRWADLKPRRNWYTITTFADSVTRLSPFHFEERAHLAMSTEQGQVEVWDVERGRKVVGWRGCQGQAITGLATTAWRDSVFIAVSSERHVELWTLSSTSARRLRTWPSHGEFTDSEMTAVAFAEVDGTLVLHVLMDGFSIERHDVNSLNRLPYLKLAVGYDLDRRNAFAEVGALGDRKVMMIGTYGEILFVDLNTGATSRRFSLGSGCVTAGRLIPNSGNPQLIIGQADHYIFLTEADPTFPPSDSSPGDAIHCSESVCDIDVCTHNGISIAVVAYDSCDHPLEVFPVNDTSKKISDFYEPYVCVRQVRIIELGQDQRVIATGDSEGRVRVWEFPEFPVDP